MSEEKKPDIPEANDAPARFLRSLKRSSTIAAVFLITLFGTNLIKTVFPVPIMFYILYICLVLVVLSIIGMLDSYTMSNIFTGFSIAFGMMIINPGNFTELKF